MTPKQYAKLNKWKLEDTYEDIFVISKICKTKADNCKGKMFSNWEYIHYTTFDVMQSLPGGDSVTIISNYGGRHRLHTSFMFTANSIENINKSKI
jgi:hypothetical protein